MKRLEQWRDVVGFEGLYQVSNLGRVKSLDRIVPHPTGGPKKLKGRVLRTTLSGMRLAVTLWKGGIGTVIQVHRIVAKVWLGPCPDGMEVCHGLNGHLDNSVSNLRYDTHTNNLLDRRRDGTHSGRCVKRSDGVEFINMHVAAEESGCHSSSICEVCRGKRKSAGGYGWEYT